MLTEILMQVIFASCKQTAENLYSMAVASKSDSMAYELFNLALAYDRASHGDFRSLSILISKSKGK